MAETVEVGILMGSRNDWETMKAAADVLAEYYKTELVNGGWELTDELSDESLYILTFTKGERELQVEIGPGEDEGITNVIITDFSY